MEKNIKFEEAMERLESEVKKLESGNMPIDEAIASFEQAVKLVRYCNEKLENAEQQVRILVSDSDGAVTDVPFDSIDET